MRQRAARSTSRPADLRLRADAAPMWWGTLGFMAIEATGFTLAFGLYLYLAISNASGRSPRRPPGCSGQPAHRGPADQPVAEPARQEERARGEAPRGAP